MNTIKNILVATDFSTPSQAALDDAVMLAEKLNATVCVLHAVEKIDECSADYCLSAEQVESAKNGLIKDARNKLDDEMQRFRDVKNVSIVTDIRYGRTIEEILEEEREKNINLLVIGPHARKTLWQRLKSHLSEKLAERSSCDTLFVLPAA